MKDFSSSSLFSSSPSAGATAFSSPSLRTSFDSSKCMSSREIPVT
jgi:hypothetical protein